jgi:hypothetical protein
VVAPRDARCWNWKRFGSETDQDICRQPRQHQNCKQFLHHQASARNTLTYQFHFTRSVVESGDNFGILPDVADDGGYNDQGSGA